MTRYLSAMLLCIGIIWISSWKDSSEIMAASYFSCHGCSEIDPQDPPPDVSGKLQWDYIGFFGATNGTCADGGNPCTATACDSSGSVKVTNTSEDEDIWTRFGSKVDPGGWTDETPQKVGPENSSGEWTWDSIDCGTTYRIKVYDKDPREAGATLLSIIGIGCTSCVD